MDPLVTVIIPNWNGMMWLPACLESLSRQRFGEFRTIVVDNGSSDHSVEFLNDCYPWLSTIRLGKNYGFAFAVNTGIREADTPFILLLNNDTIMDPFCLEHLVNNLIRESNEVGAVSALLLSMDDPELIDDAGDLFSWYGEAAKYGHGQPRSMVKLKRDLLSPCAGCTLYRKDFFNNCGYFDETFFAYLEDVDIGIRGRVFGYHYILEEKAITYHKSHGSSIHYPYYISLVTGNRLRIYLKNIPMRLLLANLHKILYGQLYFLLAYGHLGASMSGYWSFIKGIRLTLRWRREIMQKIKLESDEWNHLLGTEKPIPGIPYHLSKLKRKLIRF